MRKLIPYLYLFIPTAYALAHGGVNDGDGEIGTPNPSNRKYVLIAIIVVVALMIAWFINAKMKNKQQ